MSTTDAPGAPAAPAELGPAPRLGLGALAWTALAGASPGVLWPDGSWAVAATGVLLWGLLAHRPGKAAFWIEALVGGLGWTYLVHWSGYVFWFCLVWMGVGYAFWVGGTGWLLRRLRARTLQRSGGAPLALLVPAVWVGVETLRTITPTPFGLSWMRLGVYAHDLEPLNGAARVFGTGGLSWVLAAAAGLLGDLYLRRRERLGPALAWGLGPAALALALGLAVPAPETRPGPRVLIVQPAIPQERKHRAGDLNELLTRSLELTRAGLERERAAGRPVDLAIWGETMFLAAPYLAPGLVEAFRDGVRPAPHWTLTERDLALWQRNFDVMHGRFFDRARGGVLPEGTGLLTGIEIWDVLGGRIGRQNGAVLFDADGRPTGRGAKTNMVPAAENFLGLERYEFARAIIHDIAGYVPDLQPGSEPAVLDLTTSAGETHRFGLSICFDNAFDAPYVEPTARGADFHVVLSNEGWFKSSLELDQMVAFSRLAAIATGRAFVRATNTGISCVLGADGAELERLVVDGEDREVPGTLAATVPVPVDARARTPFVRAGLAWTLLWLAAPALIALSGRSRRSEA